MISDHSDKGPDLQQLAQTLLVMLQPLIQAGKAYVSAADDGAPGKCTQVWCPVCAAVAVASGEHHPLTAIVAEHGAALLSLLDAMARPGAPAPPGDDGGSPDDEPPPPVPGAYEPIVVTIHE